MKKLLSLLLFVAVISGCSSNVKLTDVPVEERSGANPNSNPNTAASAVSSLDARGIGSLNGVKPGPAGVSNVVYFDYDSFIVKPEFQSVLEAHARFIKADSTRRANIEGHTDERGTTEYNLALGERRAAGVRDYLVSKGIPAAQLSTISYGEERVAAQGSSESAWAQNRRTEFVSAGN